MLNISLQFQDYLYSRGKDGGSDAAYQLHSEIKNQLKAYYPDSNVDDWNICFSLLFLCIFLHPLLDIFFKLGKL